MERYHMLVALGVIISILACVKVSANYCPESPCMENAFIITQENSTIGQSSEYICLANHSFSDGTVYKNISCQDSSGNPDWEQMTENCSVVTCEVPCLQNGLLIVDAFEDENQTTWENGAIVGGSVMTYLCDNNYNFNSDESIMKEFTCQYNVSYDPVLSRKANWDIEPSSELCLPVRCGQPPCGNNNTIILEYCNNVMDNCTAEYVCKAGYSFSDLTISRSATCDQLYENSKRKGIWSSLEDECLPVTCGDPPCVNNSIVMVDSPEMDGIAFATCNEHYVFPDGTQTRNSTCEIKSYGNGSVYGEWTAITESCSPLDCGEPPCINNNTLGILLEDTLVGNSGRYLCDSGFAFPNDIVLKNFTCESLEDPVTRVLSASWSWNSAVEGECELLSCDIPSDVENATIVATTDNFIIGSTVTYRCNGDLATIDLTKEVNSTCMFYGGLRRNMSTPEFTKCYDVSCPDPECINNTVATLVDSFLPNGTAIYLCSAGYAFNISGELTISQTVTCNFNNAVEPPVSAWDDIMYHCEILTCPMPPDVANATYTTESAGFEVGTTVTFTCNEGHYLPDLNTTMNTTCEHLGGLDTNFTAMAYNACIPINCGSPDCLNNTQVMIVDGDYPGSNVTYVCDNGHATNVDGTRTAVITTTCEINMEPEPHMKWAPVTASCDPLACDNITESPDLSYDYLNGTVHYIGNIVVIACADSLSLFENYENTYELTCIEENLQPRWNGTYGFTQCYQTDCKTPPADMYADIMDEININTMQGSTIEYQCKWGFALNSSDEEKEYNYTRMCSKTDPTTNLPGPVEWQQPSGQCQALSCGIPSCRPNTIILMENNTVNSTASLLCTEGSQYDDKTYERYIFCNLTETPSVRSVSWTNTSDMCKPLECPDPSSMAYQANLARVAHTGVLIDSILTVECEEGFVIKDEGFYRKNVSCQINSTNDAEWEGLQNITCEALSCNTSFVSTYNGITDMTAIVTEDIAVNETVLNISCANDLFLDPPGTGQSYASYTCLEVTDETQFTRDISWSPVIIGTETFTCEELLCPVAENVTDAAASSNSRAVGATIAYTCEDGFYYPDGNTTQNITCEKLGPTEANWTALGFTSCTVFQCPDPMPIGNASSTQVTSKVEGDNVTFTCVDGFVFPDDSKSLTIECTATSLIDREWTIPKYNNCIVLDCPPPMPYPSTNMSDPSNTSLGAVITYTCIDGYGLSDMSSTFNITCVDPIPGQRNWTIPDDSECRAIYCPDPQSFTNATIKQDSPDKLIGAVVTYVCSGDKLFPNNETELNVTCIDTAETPSWAWSTEPQKYKICHDPAELSVKCPEAPPAFSRSARHPTLDPAGSVVSTEVWYQCDDPYLLPDMTKVTNIICQSGGNWTDLPYSHCEEYCPPVFMVQNATNETDVSQRIEGAVVRYKCISNHVLPDDSEAVNLTCLNGNWDWGTTTVNSSCTILNCGNPPEFINASVVGLSSDRSLGATLTYECVSDKTFADNTTTTEIFCDAPSPGVREWATNYTQCYDATVLELTCGTSPTITNTTRLTASGPTSSVDTKLTYQCESGLQLSTGQTTFEVTCSLVGSQLEWTEPSDTICSEIQGMETTSIAMETTVEGTDEPGTTPYMTTSRYDFTSHLVLCKGTEELIDCVNGSKHGAGLGKVIGIQWVLYGHIASYIKCDPQNPEEQSFCQDTTVSFQVIDETCKGKNKCTVDYNTIVPLIQNRLYLNDFILYNKMEEFTMPVGCSDADKYVEIAYACIDPGQPVPALPSDNPTPPATTVTDFPTTTEQQTTQIEPLSCGYADDPAYGAGFTSADFTTANYTCSEGYHFNNTGETFFTSMCNTTTGQWEPLPPPCTVIPPDCPNFGYMANGRTIPHGNMDGDLLEFTCDAGHRFEFHIDSEIMNSTCNKTTGAFEPTPERCVPIPFCEEPPWRVKALINITRSASGRIEIGDIVSYTCETGFRFAHYEPWITTVCNPIGEFNNIPGAGCVPKACPQPDEIPGTTMQIHGLTVGSYVTYTCSEPNQRFFAGDTFINVICLSTERWQTVHDSCRDSRCTTAPSFPNAFAKYGNITADEGGNTEFECFVGHHWKDSNPPERNKIFVCQNGQWTGASDAQCILDSCDTLVWPSNGTLSTNESTFDTYVTIKCNNDYKLPDDTLEAIYHCGEDSEIPGSAAAKWNGTVPVPDCVRIECPSPPTVTPSTTTVVKKRLGDNAPYLVDDSVNIRCADDYRHKNGKQSIQNYCVPPGGWSEQDMTCQLERCPFVGSLNVTNVTYFDDSPDYTKVSVEKGSKIFFMCLDGHSLMGEYLPFVYQWQSNPADPNNNQLQNYDGLLFAECINGVEWTVSWPTDHPLLPDPACLVIYCSAVPTYPNASADTTSNSAGTTVTYYCDEGFDVDGEFTFTAKCGNDANWNVSTTSRCTRTECPFPELGDDIETLLTFDETFHYGDSFELAAKTGKWFQRGMFNYTTTCSKNGTWEPELRTTTDVTCIQPETWAEVSVTLTYGYRYLSQVNATCSNNYVFNVTGTEVVDGERPTFWLATCTELGVWDPPLLSCIDPSTIVIKIPAVDAAGSSIIGTVTISVLSCVGMVIVAADFPMLLWQIKEMIFNIFGKRLI